MHVSLLSLYFKTNPDANATGKRKAPKAFYLRKKSSSSDKSDKSDKSSQSDTSEFPRVVIEEVSILVKNQRALEIPRVTFTFCRSFSIIP
jgi:hypothetical protein